MAWDVMDVDFSSFRLLLSSPVGSHVVQPHFLGLVCMPLAVFVSLNHHPHAF
jgi:hypothetical protein